MTRKSSFNKKFIIIVLAFMSMFVGLYTFFGSNGLMEIMRKKRIENNLDQDMEKMKRGNILLRSRIWSLQNSDLEVERIAREMLFLIKPGERVYLIDEK